MTAPKLDPVDAMLMQKHAALITMRKQLALSKTRKDRTKWKQWIETAEREVAALIGVRKQLDGLSAVKRAARSM